ncbi:hypothetical protein [Argonema galeatum]|uniref:hypothetical protein n=1 Tax=Argonema galeatum TaxID=2942762 RepID=UPI002012E25C|nr:hypothetical protein [Argonema galeatum]MCL1468250.1 hypothetical protein [Argonema galeatum A003/A1]
MLDFFGSEPNNTWEKSTNSTLCGVNTNVAPIDGITPHVVSNQPIAGGVSPEIKNIENLIGNADGSLILGKSAIAPQSREDLGLENYHSTSSIDALTGETRSNGTEGTISPIVEQAVRSADSYLSKLATDHDLNAKMNLAFGNSWNADVANTLVKAFANGDFSQIPSIEILPSAAINGANGAFASLTNTIYLAKEFVEQNAGNPGAIASVVLEETGHFIDSKINVYDAAGDEGDIFARVVQGKAISAGEFLGLKSEDDHAIVKLGGENIQIEQAKSFAAGDRVIDIIRQEKGSWVDGSRDAEVVLSKGDWTFNQTTGLPNMDAMNGDFVNLIAGDFDGNGLTDFIRQEKGSWVNGVNDAQVYLGAGNGTFKTPIQMTDMGVMNGNFVNLVAGDFNGDKYTDIIRQEKGSWVDGFRDAEIYISNGNGTFKNPVLMNNASAMNGNFVNLIVGDFTGGGADDIIRQEKGSWVDGNNDVQYYTFSQGNFKFQANVPNMGAMNGNFVNLVAGDFNGDRVTDLIRQEKGSWVDNNRDAEINISNGNWGFKSITTMNNASIMNGDYVNLIVGDLTGGGADDIIRQEKGNWVDGKNDVEFLTYSNGNFVKKKDAPNMSELNGNYVTLVPGLFGTTSDTTTPPNPGNGKPDIDIQLFYPNGGFTDTQKAIFEQAATNWESIITRDKVSSGILKIAITQGSKGILGSNWASGIAAESWMDSSPNYRKDNTTNSVSGNNFDGDGRTHFNSAFINQFSRNNLLRLTMHEMGHTLGLDEAQFDSSLYDTAGDSLMDYRTPAQGGQDMKITEGMYKKMEWLGYGVNRNPYINWS